jgi:hypothetical protein
MFSAEGCDGGKKIIGEVAPQDVVFAERWGEPWTER